MFDTTDKQKWAGMMIAVAGALTIPIFLLTRNWTGIGWSVTIITCGFLIRKWARTLALNQQLIDERQQYLDERHQE